MPRARPKGSVLLTRRAHHHDEGRRGDRRRATCWSPTTASRRSARTGSLTAPAGTRTIDVAGKTIMPGLVDAHSHMWAPRGLHQTEVWQYLANLAYGVTTTRDPQTSTPDVFAYADMVDAGMMPGPRIYATGPGVFSGSGIDRPRRGVPLHQALQGGVSHQHAQAVRGRRSHRPPVDHRGVQGVRHHRDHRRLARSEAEPDADGRRLLRPGAQLPDHAALQGRDEFVARTKTFYTPTILVAYGAPWSENYWFENENPVGDAKLRKWIPWELLDSMVRRRAAVVPARGVRPHADRQGRRRHRPRRRPRRARQPRPAAGAGRALGDVEPRVGRADAARDAAGGHASSAPRRSACSRTSARSRPASWRTCSCSTATRSRTSGTPTRFAT